MRVRLQASSCSTRRSGVRSAQKSRSRRRLFSRRYRVWSAGGFWCAPMRRKWMR